MDVKKTGRQSGHHLSSKQKEVVKASGKKKRSTLPPLASSWGERDVRRWLRRRMKMKKYCVIFKSEHIAGKELLYLTESELRRMGIDEADIGCLLRGIAAEQKKLREEVCRWDNKRLSQWLLRHDGIKFIDTMKENSIDGKRFLNLNSTDLDHLDIDPLERFTLLALREELICTPVVTLVEPKPENKGSVFETLTQTTNGFPLLRPVSENFTLTWRTSRSSRSRSSSDPSRHINLLASYSTDTVLHLFLNITIRHQGLDYQKVLRSNDDFSSFQGFIEEDFGSMVMAKVIGKSGDVLIRNDEDVRWLFREAQSYEPIVYLETSN